MSRNNTIFTTKEARQAGLTKKELKGLVDAGQIKRIERGVYLRSEDNTQRNIGICESSETASLLVGMPSAICLHSALEYYGLSNHTPKQVWIMVPFAKRCAHQSVRVFRSRRPQWDIGINQKEGFKITNLERTLVDMLINPKTIDLDDALYALQEALNQKKTDLHKIIAMAGKLNVVSRISKLIQIMNLLK